MRNSIESLFTRGISIGLKFLLVGYLAKELELDDYGSFQLISYFILISTTVFGLEFYNLTNRAIAKTSLKGKIYNEHLSFFISTGPFVIIIQIILFLLIFPKELISFTNIILVLTIGICDYLSQEVYRYLMINKSFRKGNIQLIYKSSLFILLIVAYNQIFQTLTFTVVLWIMLASYIILLFLAYYTFTKSLHVFKEAVFRRLNRQSLLKKLNSVFPFILMVGFIKGIEFSDKFIIAKHLGLQEIGVYSFIYQVASSINIFVMSGFYLIYLPQLIQSYTNNTKQFYREFRNFGLLILTSSICLAGLIPAISPYIFTLIDKAVFLNQMDLMYLLLIGFILNNLSLIPHSLLYIQEDEKAIMAIMSIAFVLNLVLNITLIPIFGLVGAAYSFITTYSFVFLLKGVRAYLKWKKTED